jgi:hypothetical protein
MSNRGLPGSEGGEHQPPSSTRGRPLRNLWALAAIGGGLGSVPSLGVEFAPQHLSPPATLAVILGSPALGVLAGALAYAITRRADRRYSAEIQEGRRKLVRELRDVQSVYYRQDEDSIEFHRLGPPAAVDEPDRSQQPAQQAGLDQPALQAVPNATEQSW